MGHAAVWGTRDSDGASALERTVINLCELGKIKEKEKHDEQEFESSG
jgi:hypothetical protein